MAVRIVKHAFEIIHLLTDEKPLQVLVNAIINSGPPGRFNTHWASLDRAREAAFQNIKTIAECLADELISAAKGSSNSYAIKKDELEHVAKSNL
ncbi:40S ribosomal protein S5 [Cricetulus griseus]|uniref:40S ribosomal protein S5 n=1 Tax=Cricetulus griseus TaxID=10029 RepID=G3HHT8_CRIGR|nr:40S ribosomal protein S5 [Cricetulus griseus]ERE90013.1 40S ribosomal protein S5 [Cricetulus griseus]